MSDQCLPLEQWVQGGHAEECRPCALALIPPWYRDALQAQGLGQEAQALEQVVLGGDPIQVARALDAVKGRVPPELQKTLRGYDCAVQQEELP